jgi:hypothetical protein
MEFFDQGILAEKREKYPDILLAQLLETSAEFRDWFVRQTSITTKPDQHIGVRCNEARDGRETDVLFGFRGKDGNRHFVLIENKIKAQEQPSQLEDYYKRGKLYLNEGRADMFNVCLIAPDEWLSSEYEEKVDSIIHYEDIIDRLGKTAHDGGSFTRKIFEECANDATSSVIDLTNVTEELWSRIRARSDKDLIERPGRNPTTRKNVRCTSSHTDHPPFIGYRIYISDPESHKKTSISLEADFTSSGFLDEHDLDKYELKYAISDPVAQNFSQKHPKFSEKYKYDSDSKNTILRHRTQHNEYAGFGEQDYYEGVIKEFCDFVDKVHPIIVDLRFEQIDRL